MALNLHATPTGAGLLARKLSQFMQRMCACTALVAACTFALRSAKPIRKIERIIIWT